MTGNHLLGGVDEAGGQLNSRGKRQMLGRYSDKIEGDRRGFVQGGGGLNWCVSGATAMKIEGQNCEKAVPA